MQSQDFIRLIDELGQGFANRAAQHDSDASFVAENFAVLRKHKAFSAAVPQDLGGLGVSHRQMCEAVQTLARHCGATALSFAMHQHLVAAAVWNHLHGKPGKALLEKVVTSEIGLVSTGANDWLGSSGRLEKVEGGFRLNAKKVFASGSPAGSLLITSAPYEDPEAGWQVLHFPVPLNAEGVSLGDDWYTLGMRGTGSNSVLLENVFVPEQSVALRRPRDRFHPAWSVILTVALPLIVSAYAGVAEQAASIARERCRPRATDAVTQLLLGEMENQLAIAQLAVASMIDNARDYDFEPQVERANAALIRKTIATRAVMTVAHKAMEAVGGSSYFRSAGLERLLRDAIAGQFHPLPEKRQQLFSGRLALGLDPVSDVE